MTMRPLFAAIELGGTKIVCGLADAEGKLLERVTIDTKTPGVSLLEMREVLNGFVRVHGEFAGLGIGTFGPVRLNQSADDFGRIGLTPKTDWRNCALFRYFYDAFAVPIALDTDVNAAAMGEATWGAAVGCDPVVYITVGTGIGGGVMVNGTPVHGLMHPEMGHMRVPRAAGDDFVGNCPTHGDCIEGLAAGPAVVARWGKKLSELPEGHAAYGQIGHYLARLLVNAILMLSPTRIILGGGVMRNTALFPVIRQNVLEQLNGFIAVDEIEQHIDRLIVAPGLGDDAGVLGAVALAMKVTGTPSTNVP
ncbi:MAG: ROK family protein [Woeseiaceae bacterium]